jgi:transcription elongation factor GreA
MLFPGVELTGSDGRLQPLELISLAQRESVRPADIKSLSGEIPEGFLFSTGARDMATQDARVPMTNRGYQFLMDELKRLKAVERPKIVREIEEARDHGDLSENAEFHAAKERQSLLDVQIREIEDRLARAQVIEVSRLSGDKIVFGATVSLADGDTGDKVIYQIVGDHEAEPKNGKISISSPVARALIGKSEGDEVQVRTPTGVRSFEILSVEYIE